MKFKGHSNTLDTNVNGETQQFGIGDASVVIDILRNRLYEHKVQTLVQEYICNARDAMRECGKGNEFNVTVPTRLSPVFKVRDFGPGITPDRMANVFVNYGSSTKRGSNNQTGGFGIGAKSAWSYTDSFSIITFVDGVKRTYVAHTGVNNNGRLDLVSTVTTDEPNGTEIQVGVQPDDIEEFVTAVHRAIYFWKEKPTLNGEDSGFTLVEGYKLTDFVEIIHRNAVPEYVGASRHGHAPLAVIDGVPYPIGEKLLNKCSKLNNLTHTIKGLLILHLNNGLVDVAATRESIADSPRTLDALELMARKVGVTVKTHVTAEFGKVNSTSEYFQTYRKLNEHFNVDSYAKYDSYSIESNRITSALLAKVRVIKIHHLGRYGHPVDKVSRDILSERSKQIHLEDLNKVFFVSEAESRIKESRRIKEWFKATTHLYLLEAQEFFSMVQDGTTGPNGPNHKKKVEVTLQESQKALDKLIKDLNIQDFKNIKYTEVPKEEKLKIPREKEQFCIHSLSWSGGRFIYTTLAENTDKWLYIPVVDNSWGDYVLSDLKEMHRFLKDNEGVRLCGLSPKALAMVKGDPNFSPFAEWIKGYKPSTSALNAVKADKGVNHDPIELIRSLKEKVKDKFLVDMVEEYKPLFRSRAELPPAVLITKIMELPEMKEFKTKDETLTKVLKKKYPLVFEMRYSNHKNELGFYINAKHEIEGE